MRIQTRSPEPVAEPTSADLRRNVEPGPVRSMTGYALMRQPTSAGELTVTLRSVNHRGLDLHFHQSSEFGMFENAMRGILKQQIARGHVEVRVSLDREAAAESGGYNRELLERYITLFRQACEDFQLDSKPDLNAFFAMPDVFGNSRAAKPLAEAFELEIAKAITACVENLNAYREQEGQALRASLEDEIAAIEEQTRQIAGIRAEAQTDLYRRLRERLNELMASSSVSESRLAEEAALLCDKSDVQEEVTRLMVHTQELRRILWNGGEVGKRLDFLLQEMNRETNTLLSKTSGIGDMGVTITDLALRTKANIERIREQALNLE